VILPGVTIGDDCTIGAGSVVTKVCCLLRYWSQLSFYQDIPCGVVAAGNPCKIIRRLQPKKSVKECEGGNHAAGNSTEKEYELGRRKQLFCPALSLSFEKAVGGPLQMSKGNMQWMIAADGRDYLDCRNNVAHVGHCHPMVVEAVTRQFQVVVAIL